MVTIKKIENGFIVESLDGENNPTIYAIEVQDDEEKSIDDIVRLLYTIIDEVGLTEYTSKHRRYRLAIGAEPMTNNWDEGDLKCRLFKEI